VKTDANQMEAKHDKQIARMDDGKGGSYPIELAVRLFTAFDFAIFNYAVCAGGFISLTKRITNEC
jgi:hypothetical protein